MTNEAILCPRCLEPVETGDLARRARYEGRERTLHAGCYAQMVEMLPAPALSKLPEGVRGVRTFLGPGKAEPKNGGSWWSFAGGTDAGGTDAEDDERRAE